MSSAPATLHARLLAGREASVSLPNGKTVRVRRPPEVEIPRLLLEGDVADFLACVVGWQGFTEADVLGPEAGTAPVEFDPALWLDLAKDHTDWCRAVADRVKAMCAEHIQKREAASGN